jgi:hypothetical protein
VRETYGEVTPIAHKVRSYKGGVALALDLRAPVRRRGADEQARRGIGRTPIPFRQGSSPVEKPGRP